MTRRKKTSPDASAHIVRPTVIEFILDETGSMSSCHQQTVAGYNTFINEQKKVAGECLMTLTKFDSSGQKVPFVDLDLSMVVPMTMNTFCPGGGTNLYDTVGNRVTGIEQRLSDWNVQPNVLVIVLTDGGENASRTFSSSAIQNLIRTNEAKGWTFVYLGPPGSAYQAVQHMGFQPGNVKQFDSAQMEQTMADLSNATTAYRATRATTSDSSTSYFG